MDDEDFIAFVMDSEYDILLRWEDLSFKGTMNLNVDGNRAFQTVQLQDPSGFMGEASASAALESALDAADLGARDTSDFCLLTTRAMVSRRDQWCRPACLVSAAARPALRIVPRRRHVSRLTRRNRVQVEDFFWATRGSGMATRPSQGRRRGRPRERRGSSACRGRDAGHIRVPS